MASAGWKNGIIISKRDGTRRNSETNLVAGVTLRNHCAHSAIESAAELCGRASSERRVWKIKLK